MSNTTFIPESGLHTENNLNVQSNTTPRGISAPPAVVKEADKVSEELSALGNSIGSKGHPIGRYHSCRSHDTISFNGTKANYEVFYELLTWKHPRASGLILTVLLSSIIFTQSLWIVLASTTVLEVAGQFVFRSNEGLVAQFAPKEYFTVSQESLDPIFSEVYSLTNFAVVEFQRLLFVRNVRHTSIAFVLSFVAYNLIKFLPLWALTMIGLVLAFTLPPVYIQNQAAIDAQLNKASEMGSVHFNNAKDAASKHASAASEKARLTAIDLGNKAGVDVHRYISGPGPVQSESVLDNLASQPKTTTTTTSSSKPSATLDELIAEIDHTAATTSSSTTTSSKPTTSGFEFEQTSGAVLGQNLSNQESVTHSTTSHVVSSSTPIADEFSAAPSLPSTDGVYVGGEQLHAV